MPNYPLSGYKINSLDLYGEYKIKVRKITGLLTFLNRKGETLQSWPDVDGEEAFIEASDIYFEGNDVFMFCSMLAASYSEMKTLLEDFKAILEGPGLKAMTLPYEGDTYSIMYVGGSNVTVKTPKVQSEIYCEFFIQFRQVTPRRS